MAEEVPPRRTLDPRRDRRDPLVSIKIYVEGGGDSKSLRTACRKGFRLFIENAGISCRGIGVGIVACGPRQDAYDSFTTANSTMDDRPMLLATEASRRAER